MTWSFAQRIPFSCPEEHRASVLQQLPGLALDTLYSAMVVKCQVVSASAAEREENLISGVRERHEDLPSVMFPMDIGSRTIPL